MPARSVPAAADQTREERIEAIPKELRPKVEATVRRMVERAVDVPEAEEFGAIDFEFHDAGQQLANEVRQATVASRFRTRCLGRTSASQARAVGITQVSDLIAVTDGGNGLEEALQRHLAENLSTILDWYHAVEHLGGFARLWHARDEVAGAQ
jgi:hypothetical protein